MNMGLRLALEIFTVRSYFSSCCSLWITDLVSCWIFLCSVPLIFVWRFPFQLLYKLCSDAKTHDPMMNLLRGKEYLFFVKVKRDCIISFFFWDKCIISFWSSFITLWNGNMSLLSCSVPLYVFVLSYVSKMHLPLSFST